ncbi:hypothetical protein N9T32_00995 [bacterium]|nr:hypothetical protein [bacterium]
MTDAVPELAPVAEHERLKVLLPPTPMLIDSDPEVPFEPDQDPDAEQLVASEDDQVRVVEELTSAESAEEVRETVIFWGAGAVGADPPPPPPPQLIKKILINPRAEILIAI